MEKSLDLRKLKHSIDRIFDHIFNTLQVENLNLSEDYYFEILGDKKYKVSEEISEHSIGSLYDDLDFVMSSLEWEDEDTEIPPIMLMHIAPLLQYLGEYENWYKQK